ncbi:DMT family transporter [Luteococcus sp. OSA5]|uniref:DMT family transporter n=1 Tax=Luteococcus sp. OSA5 TaxID=3401630 RepID=UPI003B435195
MPGLDESPRCPALLLVGAILAEVTGSLSLKGAVDRPWLYAVVAVAYALAFTLLAWTLRTGMPLGVAYGVWAACGVALTAVLSNLLFAEPISLVMGLGLLLVMAGVLCVELGARGGQDRAGT